MLTFCDIQQNVLIHFTFISAKLRTNKVELMAQLRKQQARLEHLQTFSDQYQKQVCFLSCIQLYIIPLDTGDTSCSGKSY